VIPPSLCDEAIIIDEGDKEQDMKAGRGARGRGRGCGKRGGGRRVRRRGK
jgi:hypothetical protein